MLLFVVLISCSSTKNAAMENQTKLLNNSVFKLTRISTDKTYAYTEKNPVKVGGVDKSEGPMNERRFLNALAGPGGEDIWYTRRGSCCHFKTPNGFLGGGLLDVYSVTWQGTEDTVSLYINMYDYGPLYAPVGFTIR